MESMSFWEYMNNYISIEEIEAVLILSISLAIGFLFAYIVEKIINKLKNALDSALEKNKKGLELTRLERIMFKDFENYKKTYKGEL